jgi:hypothetical protein
MKIGVDGCKKGKTNVNQYVLESTTEQKIAPDSNCVRKTNVDLDHSVLEAPQSMKIDLTGLKIGKINVD